MKEHVDIYNENFKDLINILTDRQMDQNLIGKRIVIDNENQDNIMDTILDGKHNPKNKKSMISLMNQS